MVVQLALHISFCILQLFLEWNSYHAIFQLNSILIEWNKDYTSKMNQIKNKFYFKRKNVHVLSSIHSQMHSNCYFYNKFNCSLLIVLSFILCTFMNHECNFLNENYFANN